MKVKYLSIIRKSFVYFCFVAEIVLSEKDKHPEQSGMKYILKWTKNWKSEMTKIIPTGQDFFINNNCPVQNCYFIWRQYQSYLQNITDYDALLFHGPRSGRFFLRKFPAARSPNQLYIFMNKETPAMYPICEEIFDNDFFNVTVTYRFDSDIRYQYMVVRNMQGEIIGPAREMHWMKNENMLPVDDNIKRKLTWKYKAAAWFVSKCGTPGRREVFVKGLQKELQKYKLKIDVYGGCGQKACGQSESKTLELDSQCWGMIGTDYYFYLAFENSFSEDYVSEKLLNALQYYTVPIVYGGANYTRFLSDGMYLNALTLGVENLAREMYAIMKDKEKYYTFFKWRNHYSYHDPNIDSRTDPFCKICAYLNDKHRIKQKKSYTHFLDWWNGRGACQRNQKKKKNQDKALKETNYKPKQFNRNVNGYERHTHFSSLLEDPENKSEPLNLLVYNESLESGLPLQKGSDTL